MVQPRVAQRGRRFCSLPCRDVEARKRVGPAAAAWRGGVSTTGDGYKLIYKGRDHPMANHHGYVPEHRLVMSEHLGRPLTGDEHVHHINEDISDNRLKNLEILSRADHTRHHNQGKSRSLSRWSRKHECCIRCGTTERKHNARGLCVNCYMEDERAKRRA